MTRRRTVRNDGPRFCPQWGVIVDEYTPPGRMFPIAEGDIVRVQFRKYETIHEARVMKIVASKETGDIAEVDLVVQGDGRAWNDDPKTLHERECRTVTPDKISRIPRNRQEEEEEMKVTGYTGELPTRKGGGRTRAANPFDEHVAKGGKHQVHLDENDDPVKVTRQIQAAARYANKSARVFNCVDEDGSLIFVVGPKRTRKDTDEKSEKGKGKK